MRLQTSGMYHVTTRSIAEEHIFRDAGDYSTGIRILAEIVGEQLMVCHQFCFMPTHYHLLGSFEEGQLSRAIHKLNRRYATRFNRRYTRHGHVFDSPYAANLIDSESYFFSVVRYVALNPENPETWPYSSYPGLIGKRVAFEFVDPTPLVDAFGNVEEVRRYVNDGRALQT